jgi:hypothetical protein
MGPNPMGTVGSEFAEVAVSLDYEANGIRLRLEDRRGGRVRYLDALELETIIWLPDEHLARLLDRRRTAGAMTEAMMESAARWPRNWRRT